MNPLEASHYHLLVTPHSHFKSQKADGQVGMFLQTMVYQLNGIRAENSVKQILSSLHLSPERAIVD